MISTESCSISTLAASTRQEGRLEMTLFSTDSRNSLDTSTRVCQIPETPILYYSEHQFTHPKASILLNSNTQAKA
uniref:Uncharacterized protein n=1 Tax=Rhizophora mucronata TaxID=61149 RepID=A0A2P2MT50_RHIMU